MSTPKVTLTVTGQIEVPAEVATATLREQDKAPSFLLMHRVHLDENTVYSIEVPIRWVMA